MRKTDSKIPVISFVGKSNSGKTTLLEKVIKEFKKDGMRIAVIKHDAHKFEIDQPGKDTWRHAQAGADIVAISSPEKFAFIEKRAAEISLDEIISRISDVDVIFTEGYKTGDKPKIEVFRSAVHNELVSSPKDLICIASDIKWVIGVPCYDIDDVKSVVVEVRKYIEKFEG